MKRTGVILAAGFGSRLRAGGSGFSLKPLTLVDGVPLLVRAVRSLAEAGCARVVVVVGHGARSVEDELRRHVGTSVDLVVTLNPRYDLKNGVSVLAARPHLLGDEFVLMMADHVVDDDVMHLARDTQLEPGSAALLVDAKLDTIFDMDDATKVLVAGGRIHRIGKELPEYSHVDCGVFVCTSALMDAIGAVYDARGDASLSDGVQELAARGKMYVVDIGAGFWQDVDTPEMLAHAEAVLRRRAELALARVS